MARLTLTLLALIAGMVGGVLGLQWLGAYQAGAHQAQSAPAPASASTLSPFQRVTSSNTLRCGYVLYPPFVMRDPNSGAFSGIVVELLEALGQTLNLKIEWTEEVGWATTVEGLKSGRYDALCVGFWRQALEARHVMYTRPFAHSQLMAVARPDDTRFNGNGAAVLAAINQPGIRIQAIDGEVAAALAPQQFAKATLQTAPNLTDISQVLTDVVSNKADIAFIERFIISDYLAKNPGKLRVLDTPPLRTFQNTLAFLPDPQLQSLLDTALIELAASGALDAILDRYDPTRQNLIRVDRIK